MDSLSSDLDRLVLVLAIHFFGLYVAQKPPEAGSKVVISKFSWGSMPPDPPRFGVLSHAPLLNNPAS